MQSQLWDSPKLFDHWRELAIYIIKNAEDSWIEGTCQGRDDALLFFNSDEFVYWCEVADIDPNKMRATILQKNPTPQGVFTFA